MCTFGILLLVVLFGIVYYLKDAKISLLLLACFLTFMINLISIVLRLFCSRNLKAYLIGLFAYLFMIPTYMIIMQIYAMANLHDLSWGNRPTSGAKGLTFNKDKQDQLNENYQYYRFKRFTLWILSNLIVCILYKQLLDANLHNDRDCTKLLDFMILLVTSLMLFRVICSFIYKLKWLRQSYKPQAKKD